MARGSDLPVAALENEGVDRASGMTIRRMQALDHVPDHGMIDGMTCGNPDFVLSAGSGGAKDGGVAVPVDDSEHARVPVDELGGHAPQVEPD